MKNLQMIFNEVASKHELAEDMINEFRNMNLTDKEYNTIIVDWDSMLNKFYNNKG